MSGIFLTGSLLLLLALGVPVAFALGTASLMTLLFFTDQSLLTAAQKFLHTAAIYPLLALPFFILAGNFMATGGVAKRMIVFAQALVGSLRGGLPMAAVLSCMLFAAVSGSSPATVVAVGSIVIGGMVSCGYSRPFAAGLICNAGTLGILIPPSIVLVVYGAVTETSIGDLFMAGLIPGLLLTACLMVATHIACRFGNTERSPWVGWRAVARAFRDASWGLLLVILVLGGIYGGVFTPTEAAAMAAVYACLVAVLVHRDLKPRDIYTVLLKSGRTSAMLMFIIANALLFAFVLTSEQIPQIISQQLIDAGLPPWAFLLALNALLLVAGNFMEPTSVILILAPILFPIAMDLGIDPVHLGIIMVVNLEIGMVTPPVGLNLFVTSEVSRLPVEQVIRAAAPWLALLLSVLIIVTYVPAVSLWLPGILKS